MEPAERDRLIVGYLHHLANLGAVPVPSAKQISRSASARFQSELNAAQELFRLAVEADDSFWAWEEIHDLVASDAESAWGVLLEIIAAAPEGSLSMVGAGPLENLVHNHHEKFAERVVEELKVNRRFLKAFRSAYLFDVPEDTWRSFNQAMVAAGVPEAELGEGS